MNYELTKADSANSFDWEEEVSEGKSACIWVNVGLHSVCIMRDHDQVRVAIHARSRLGGGESELVEVTSTNAEAIL